MQFTERQQQFMSILIRSGGQEFEDEVGYLMGLTRKSVTRISKKLLHFGIVTKEDGVYSLAEDWEQKSIQPEPEKPPPPPPIEGPDLSKIAFALVRGKKK